MREVDESFAQDRALYLALSALALARPGKQRDLDAAVHRAMTSIELAESLDSALGIGLLRDFSHQITPHAKLPVVRDFLDQARDFTAG